MRDALAKLGVDPGGGTPEEFGTIVHAEIARWGKIVKDANIKDPAMSSDFRVTLLGTGVPIPSPERFGPSTLVEAGDQKFLIDAGRGATIRLYQLKIPIGRIDVQLLTHYHSDHISCLPDVWLTGWLESHFGTRKTPYKVIGPTGAKRLMENLERAYADDIKIRVADEKLPLSGIATDVTEFDRDGLVYEKSGVKVIAFEVDHGDVIKPCYGYRIEYGGRVAVFSSDTRYNQNVIKYGKGADLLVHEVAMARPELMKEAYIQRIIGHHTTPYDCGRVFAQTRPKLAAFTHVVQLASTAVPPPTLDDSSPRSGRPTTVRSSRRGPDVVRDRRHRDGEAAMPGLMHRRCIPRHDRAAVAHLFRRELVAGARRRRRVFADSRAAI